MKAFSMKRERSERKQLSLPISKHCIRFRIEAFTGS
jgi:hypothetical protein